METRVILEFRVRQEQGLLPLLVWQKRLPGVMFPVRDVLWQVLVLALRQEENADDANERTAGKDHMVQEVAFLVMELHDWCSQHTKACAGQDEAKSTSPAKTHRLSTSSSYRETYLLQQAWILNMLLWKISSLPHQCDHMQPCTDLVTWVSTTILIRCACFHTIPELEATSKVI